MFKMSTRLFDFMQIVKMVLIPEISHPLGLVSPKALQPSHRPFIPHKTLSRFVRYI